MTNRLTRKPVGQTLLLLCQSASRIAFPRRDSALPVARNGFFRLSSFVLCSRVFAISTPATVPAHPTHHSSFPLTSGVPRREGEACSL